MRYLYVPGARYCIPGATYIIMYILVYYTVLICNIVLLFAVGLCIGVCVHRALNPPAITGIHTINHYECKRGIHLKIFTAPYISAQIGSTVVYHVYQVRCNTRYHIYIYLYLYIYEVYIPGMIYNIYLERKQLHIPYTSISG